MDLIKRAGTALTVACAAVLATASPAPAAMTIGQVAPSSGVLQSCATTPTDLLQPSVTAGGNLYSARAAGTITSWSTRSAAGAGSYTLKVFRRTTDPDVFRVIGHSGPQPLDSGVNTFSSNLPVSSGDLIGVNASGAGNNCSFESAGDFVLASTGDVSDGGSATFCPSGSFPPCGSLDDQRLNLSATLVPTNSFSFGRITRDRRKGSATLEVLVSNPGSVTLTGKGVKAKRATKTTFLAGPIKFSVAAAGKKGRKLKRRGKTSLRLTATFTPTGGDAAAQTLALKLKKRRRVARR